MSSVQQGNGSICCCLRLWRLPVHGDMCTVIFYRDRIQLRGIPCKVNIGSDGSFIQASIPQSRVRLDRQCPLDCRTSGKTSRPIRTGRRDICDS